MQSAYRAISILLAIAESSQGLKINEIRESLGLPRQVTYHLIHTLRQTGIIRKNSSNRYVLGAAAASIGEGFQRQLAPLEHLAHRVQLVVSATHETAYVSGWLDSQIVVLVTARGDAPVGASQVPQGFRDYAHARASGKLLLALADPSVARAYLAEHSLDRRTANTITDPVELLKEFEKIRELRYSIDNEEFHIGLRCVAVPIEGTGGQFSIAVSVPSERFQEKFDCYLSVLRDAARAEAGQE